MLYVSDSHSLSYKIARKNGCEVVYLFDSHCDLGYGGISSLDFETNCSNWLGKLLKEGHIKRAFIFYSPYTSERPQCFKEFCELYNVKFCAQSDLCGEKPLISAVHICRSGAWTPPWFDEEFFKFVDSIELKREIIDCTKRKWDPAHVNLSNRIRYLIG